ncbi:hypothetical protein HYC85_003479 [Camellia sinensis]|uniref:Uncharacterized protein n=1 Tax=Camellia sinensis TaxID=4442 RepID=A0A7J7HW02_CAMSI|nr:hypothetical protein HYC85_003479 [Camellia sinensis]
MVDNDDDKPTTKSTNRWPEIVIVVTSIGIVRFTSQIAMISGNPGSSPLSAKDERSVSPNASKDAGIGHSKDIADQLGPLGSCGDHHLYPSNIYAPQAQAIYYKVSYIDKILI